MTSDNKFNFLKDDFNDEEKPINSSTKKQPTKSSTQKQSKSRATKKRVPTPKNTPAKTKEIQVAPELKTESEKKVGKRSNPHYKTVGIQIPISLHKQAKVLLMDNEDYADFSELMTDLLDDWIKAQKNG